MNREQLEHAIRAAAAISGESSIVIIGSQSLLGSYPDAPEALVASMEVDAFPEQAPEKSDIIDGCIGELSPFHETYGYYVHGVGPEAALLPLNWRSRLVRIQTAATCGSIGWCLSPEDLAVSKLLAGRDKDVQFVKGMVAGGLVSLDSIRTLEHELDADLRSRLAVALRVVVPHSR